MKSSLQCQSLNFLLMLFSASTITQWRTYDSTKGRWGDVRGVYEIQWNSSTMRWTLSTVSLKTEQGLIDNSSSKTYYTSWSTSIFNIFLSNQRLFLRSSKPAASGTQKIKPMQLRLHGTQPAISQPAQLCRAPLCSMMPLMNEVRGFVLFCYPSLSFLSTIWKRGMANIPRMISGGEWETPNANTGSTLSRKGSGMKKKSHGSWRWRKKACEPLRVGWVLSCSGSALIFFCELIT